MKGWCTLMDECGRASLGLPHQENPSCVLNMRSVGRGTLINGQQNNFGFCGLPHLTPILSACLPACLSVCQHMNSRRHKDRLAGKSPKPSSQHSKLQKQAALAVSALKVPVSRQWSTRESGRKGQLKDLGCGRKVLALQLPGQG